MPVAISRREVDAAIAAAMAMGSFESSRALSGALAEAYRYFELRTAGRRKCSPIQTLRNPSCSARTAWATASSAGVENEIVNP